MLNFTELQNQLKPIINNELLRFPFVMQAFIGSQMVNTGLKTRIAPSTNARLEINTGNLFRSFARGGVGNIYKANVSGNSYELEYGSSLPYARIHEYGGFIESKGNMHKYFWARFAETKNTYFRNLALHVEKKGGVTIPKRPYFAPALQKFKTSGKYQDEVKAKVIQGIREWQESQRQSQV
jgi:phage gpG-like protein